jgi:hypothetical protein
LQGYNYKINNFSITMQPQTTIDNLVGEQRALAQIAAHLERLQIDIAHTHRSDDELDLAGDAYDVADYTAVISELPLPPYANKTGLTSLRPQLEQIATKAQTLLNNSYVQTLCPSYRAIVLALNCEPDKAPSVFAEQLCTYVGKLERQYSLCRQAPDSGLIKRGHLRLL